MGDDRKNKPSKKDRRVSLVCRYCNIAFLVSPYRKNSAIDYLLIFGVSI